MIGTVIVTYSTIRNSPIQQQPLIQSAIDETNLAIKQILGFTVGYYGSILKVTGNTTYANTLALNYLRSGMENIANIHPEWGTSFNVSTSQLYTFWYTNSSYSTGNLGVNYSLAGLGISGITYQTQCKLNVTIINMTANQAFMSVNKDENEPLINLGRSNFRFFKYNNLSSGWDLVNPSIEPIAYANGSYQIDVPAGVDPYSYFVQVTDTRGIMVVASSFNRYVCSLNWNNTVYSNMLDPTVVVELMQNGTMRWLGQNITSTMQTKPVPPVPVKSIHLNQTTNGVNSEVPFQVEDWASEYRIPLGMSSNETVFNGRTMVVFLVNPNVSKVTLWWNGSDSATQTPNAYANIYFKGDDPGAGFFTNGNLSLSIQRVYEGAEHATVFKVTSAVGNSSCTTKFMRINRENSTYGANASYVIHHGVIRDIIQQEAEWSSGISEYLYVDSFNGSNQQWSASGSNPYLNDNNDYIYTNGDSNIEGWFGLQNLSTPTLVSASVEFQCRYPSGQSGDDYFSFQITDGVSTFGWYDVTGLSDNDYAWKSYDITRIINSTQSINNAMINIRYRQSGGSATQIRIQRARLNVVTCPNLYSQIVLMLPANATYYTYQLRSMFVESQQNRSITDLCPIRLSGLTGTPQTENGTMSGYPIVSNATDSFYNYSASVWAHHWSQISSGTKGAGIMFTDTSAQRLYAFDSIATTKTGALKVNSPTGMIELLPVTMVSANFTYALDVTWEGAVVTFDGSTPIYKIDDATGLWMIVEYPPTATVYTES